MKRTNPRKFDQHVCANKGRQYNKLTWTSYMQLMSITLHQLKMKVVKLT